MVRYVIYGIYDPIETYKCLYVGKCENLDIRARQWLRSRASFIREIIDRGYVPIFKTLEIIVDDYQKSLERERYWIDFMDKLGMPLQNRFFPDVTLPSRGFRQSRNQQIDGNELLRRIVQCYNEGVPRTEVLRMLHVGTHRYRSVAYVYNKMQKGEEIVIEDDEDEEEEDSDSDGE